MYLINVVVFLFEVISLIPIYFILIVFFGEYGSNPTWFTITAYLGIIHVLIIVTKYTLVAFRYLRHEKEIITRRGQTIFWFDVAIATYFVALLIFELAHITSPEPPKDIGNSAPLNIQSIQQKK